MIDRLTITTRMSMTRRVTRHDDDDTDDDAEDGAECDGDAFIFTCASHMHMQSTIGKYHTRACWRQSW